MIILKKFKVGDLIQIKPDEEYKRIFFRDLCKPDTYGIIIKLSNRSLYDYEVLCKNRIYKLHRSIVEEIKYDT